MKNKKNKIYKREIQKEGNLEPFAQKRCYINDIEGYLVFFKKVTF